MSGNFGPRKNDDPRAVARRERELARQVKARRKREEREARRAVRRESSWASGSDEVES